MITDVQTLTVSDLSVSNQIYNLKEKIDMSALRFYMNTDILMENKDKNSILNNHVYDFIENKFMNSEVWLFIVHIAVDNKISRYKRFWKSSIVDELELNKFSYFAKDIILSDKPNVLNIASMVKVDKSNFSHAINILKLYSNRSIMIVSNDRKFDSINNIQNIYNLYCKPFCSGQLTTSFLKTICDKDTIVRAGDMEGYCSPFIDFFTGLVVG